MNFQDTAIAIWNALVYTATSSDYVVPFWAAVAWVLLLLNRKAGLALVLKGLHVSTDAAFIRDILKHIDLPLQILLVLLAGMPFFRLVPHAGHFLLLMAGFLVPLLAFHVILQTSDLIIFRLYFGKVKHSQVPAVIRVSVLSVLYIVFTLMLLDWSFHINVVPLFATSTVITAVFGLSLQDTIRNLFAGITLSVEQRLKQGDWIMFRTDSGANATGEVEEMGWRTTRIRTGDNDHYIVPNAQLTSNQLVNFSAPAVVHARAIDLPVSLDCDIDEVKAKLIQAVYGSQGVLDEPAVEVAVVNVKTDHATLRVKFWVAEVKSSDGIANLVLEQSFKRLHEIKALPHLKVLAIKD